jgi:hypothetical protein
MAGAQADRLRELLDFVRQKIDALQRELAFWQALHDVLAQAAARSGDFVTADVVMRARQQEDRKIESRRPVSVSTEWRDGCVAVSFSPPVRRKALAWLEERLARRLGLSVVWQEEKDRVSAVELCGIDSEEKRAEVERILKWLERRLAA